MKERSGYAGLDVHKETIVVAVTYAGRSRPKSLGIITNTKRSVFELIGKLSVNGESS